MDKIDYLEKQINDLQNKLLQRDLELESLEDRLFALEERKKKERQRDLTSNLKLIEWKEDFQNLNPYSYKEPMDDYQLVFWGSFLSVKEGNKPDKIDSVKELAQRSRKIKKLVEYFSNYAKEHGIVEKECENWARIRIYNYIEYIIKLIKDKDGNTPSFYQYTSDWYISEYGSKVATWQKLAKFEDKEL